MEECSMKGSGQTQLALTTEKKKKDYSANSTITAWKVLAPD